MHQSTFSPSCFWNWSNRDRYSIASRANRRKRLREACTLERPFTNSRNHANPKFLENSSNTKYPMIMRVFISVHAYAFASHNQIILYKQTMIFMLLVTGTYFHPRSKSIARFYACSKIWPLFAPACGIHKPNRTVPVRCGPMAGYEFSPSYPAHTCMSPRRGTCSQIGKRLFAPCSSRIDLCLFRFCCQTALDGNRR